MPGLSHSKRTLRTCVYILMGFYSISDEIWEIDCDVHVKPKPRKVTWRGQSSIQVAGQFKIWKQLGLLGDSASTPFFLGCFQNHLSRYLGIILICTLSDRSTNFGPIYIPWNRSVIWYKGLLATVLKQPCWPRDSEGDAVHILVNPCLTADAEIALYFNPSPSQP